MNCLLTAGMATRGSTPLAAAAQGRQKTDKIPEPHQESHTTSLPKRCHPQNTSVTPALTTNNTTKISAKTQGQAFSKSPPGVTLSARATQREHDDL